MMDVTEHRVSSRQVPPTHQAAKPDPVWSGEQYAAERDKLLGAWFNVARLIAAKYGNTDLRALIVRELGGLKDLLQDEVEMRERFAEVQNDVKALSDTMPEVFNDPQPVN